MHRQAYLFTIAAVSLLSACGSEEPTGTNEPNTPVESVPKVPVLRLLTPSSATVSAGGFELTAHGDRFVPQSKVLWGTDTLTTNFQSDTLLTASVLASHSASVGVVSVAVGTPAPGGGMSSSLPFEVGFPVPTLDAISPATGMAGIAGLTLTVRGQGFDSSTTVLWNNQTLQPTHVQHDNRITRQQRGVTDVGILPRSPAATTDTPPHRASRIEKSQFTRARVRDNELSVAAR